MFKRLTILLSHVSGELCSQAESLSGFGLLAGINRSVPVWTLYDSDIPVRGENGLALGFTYTYWRFGRLSLSTEFHYLRKRISYSDSRAGDSDTNGPSEYTYVEYDQSLLCLRILPKVRILADPVMLELVAGPRLDISMNRRVMLNPDPDDGVWATTSSDIAILFGHPERAVEYGGSFGSDLGIQVSDALTAGIFVRYNPNVSKTLDSHVWNAWNHSFDTMLALTLR